MFLELAVIGEDPRIVDPVLDRTVLEACNRNLGTSSSSIEADERPHTHGGPKRQSRSDATDHDDVVLLFAMQRDSPAVYRGVSVPNDGDRTRHTRPVSTRVCLSPDHRWLSKKVCVGQAKCRPAEGDYRSLYAVCPIERAIGTPTVTVASRSERFRACLTANTQIVPRQSVSRMPAMPTAVIKG